MVYDKYDRVARKELKRMLSIYYPNWKGFASFNGNTILTLQDDSKISIDKLAIFAKRDRLLPVVIAKRDRLLPVVIAKRDRLLPVVI